MKSSLLVFALLVSLGCSEESPAGNASGGAAGTASGGAAGSASGGTSASGGASGSGGSGAGGTGGVAGGSAGAGGGAGASNFVPYFFDDFESYTDGESLSGKAFGAAGRTTASGERAHGGNQSARMAIEPGDQGGFGQWGGIVQLEPELPKGQEIWVRLYVNWPQAFEFSASPWMKFLRLHNKRGDGGNGGYNDLYVDNADSTTSVLRTIKEVHDVWAVFDGPKIPRDQWERYEMYLYIDDVPVDAGGEGRVRIWRDDALIFDRTDVPTITAADGTIDAFYLFTYWNNETPPSNHVYVDDLVIATSKSPPPNQDAAGNAIIGTW